MPTYEITAPNGKTLEVTGDHVPTEPELHQIFAAAGVETGAAAPASAPPPAGMPAKAPNPFDAMRGQTLADNPDERARTAAGAKLVPSVLGAVGGLAGGIPGAAAGGAVGKAVEQTVLRGQGDASVPQTTAGQAKDIATSGAVQGAAEGAGQLLNLGAAKMSTWLMNRAVNATDRLSREFPEMSQTLIDNAITVSQGGLNKARRLLMTAKAEANTALKAAESQGVTIPIQAATNGLTKTVGEVMNSGDPIGGLNALAKAERNITAGRAAELTPTAADALKRSLQADAKNLYLAAKMGNGRPALQVMAQGKADMAAALNDAIETATTSAGASGYKAANHSAQQLIGAVRGVTKGIRPGANLYQAMVRPGVGAVLGGSAGEADGHPLLGALAGAAATSPLGMSLAAIGLDSAAGQTLVRQLPRGVATALQNYLASQPATAPPQTGNSGPTR